MNKSQDYLKLILDTVTDHIVVIDSKGNIQYINRSWNKFAQNNSCQINDKWVGVNYLDECDRAGAMGDDFGIQAAKGIRQVINLDQEAFYFEYPCHSPKEKRWFMMRVTPFSLEGKSSYVISHQNITERKLAEEEVKNLARIDGLTNIPNRRYFDEFLASEWSRSARLGVPVSLALIDLDHFKLLNDTYGHQTGDECLKQFSAMLKQFAKRPSDLCARYGGEEFAIVYGDTNLEQARMLLIELNETVRKLAIANEKSPVSTVLTASIGLATIHPNKENSAQEIIQKADSLLYSAKSKGRDQIVYAQI